MHQVPFGSSDATPDKRMPVHSVPCGDRLTTLTSPGGMLFAEKRRHGAPVVHISRKAPSPLVFCWQVHTESPVAAVAMKARFSIRKTGSGLSVDQAKPFHVHMLSLIHISEPTRLLSI